MIQINGNIIEMHTQDTSYIIRVGQDAPAQCLHYGARIRMHDAGPLLMKVDAGYGSDVLYQATKPALSSLCLELAPTARGDYRKGSLLMKMPGGAATTEYTYRTAQLKTGSLAPAGGMPQGRQPDDVLVLTYGENSGLMVEMFYSLFYDANVITKKMRITNHAGGAVELKRVLSQQLDLPRTDFDLYTLGGAWARERHVYKHSLQPGAVTFGSGTGASGNRCNPFFFLAQKHATEFTGEVYGFNLVYSGSHEGSVEVDTHGKMRIMNGIWSDGFGWTLQPGESFVTPEAVLTYSNKGKNGMSQNMHRFVRQHILPPQWEKTPRPVLVNNWEGTYFKFNQSKLLGMAKVASRLGVELFVLDDGWFGQRDSDTAGLGDYIVNRKKLPGGLKGLAQSINKMGMQFGLWFEPEMVNANSELFRKHPDWIVQTPGYVPATGRHQYVLDLCRAEVRRYIIENVNKVLDSANIEYVKWDMNRHISDNYSPELQEQGGFMHRYTLGLYQLFEEICQRHPNILFEGCASGGNRFDLGVLYYMPQIWTSDDTDAYERQKIQTGTSYGYPPCTMGCHVSAVPNHQTLRVTPLETRFNVAAFGVLGYELDMRHLTMQQKEDIKAQIAYYKQHRMLLQYGEFLRLKSPFEEDGCRWMSVSADKTEAILGDYSHLLEPNSAQPPMRLAGLDEEKLYRLAVRPQKMNVHEFGGLVNYLLPINVNPEGALVGLADKVYRLDTEKESYTAYGSLLCNAGIKRLQPFTGSGHSEKMRLMGDFASRLYYIKEVAEE